jgi:hypothetical protein
LVVVRGGSLFSDEKKEKTEKEKKGSSNSGFGQCPGTWFARIWSK